MWSANFLVVIAIFGTSALLIVAALIAYGLSCHKFYAWHADACHVFDSCPEVKDLPEHWQTLLLDELHRAAREADSILLPSEIRRSVQAVARMLARLRLMHPEQVVQGASIDGWWRFVHARRALDDRTAFVQACSQAILTSIHVMGKEKPEGDRYDSGC